MSSSARDGWRGFPAGWVSAGLGLALGLAAPGAQSAPPPAAGAAPEFFREHCHACHGRDKQKGDLRLDPPPSVNDRTTWERVLEMVESGEMPPPDKPRPAPEQARAAARWVAALPALADATPPTALRRLNRVEYEHTLNDLLGIELPLAEVLPEDGRVQGFDTVSDGLSLSSVLLERYLEAANLAFDGLIRRYPASPAQTRRVRLMDVKENQDSVRLKRGGVIEAGGSFVKFTPGWPPARIDPAHPTEDGVYDCRIAVWPHEPGPRTLAVAIYAGPLFGPGKLRFIGMYDVTGTPENPREIAFTTRLSEGHTLHIVPWVYPPHVTWRDKHEARPGIGIAWVETRGPLDQDWPSAAQTRLCGALPMKEGGALWMRHRKGVRVHQIDSPRPREDLQRILGAFASRAFRRPVSAEEAQPFVELALRRLDAGREFEAALRTGFCAILCSPRFLLLNAGPTVDGYDIASRMSYFLWSSAPDENLLRLAAEGRLGDPEVRRRVAGDMLADARASRFVEHFTGQWLGLRQLDATTPDAKLYPEFDPLLQESMRGETVGVFRHMLDGNDSVYAFLRADHTLLNERLAAHYGIDGVRGHESFQWVALPAGSPRGGVLGQAAIHKVTANGTTSSPVLRGAWVLDHLLGRPAPPPPPGVPAVEPDIRGATTLREQLDRHREDESCARCHRRIDPPGFALEVFDPIGGWRDHYRALGVKPAGPKLPYGTGRPVDASGVTPDGRAFDGFLAYRDRLWEDRETFRRALAEKLLVYGSGRPMTPAGRSALDGICAASARAGDGLRDLIQAVAASEAFIQP